MKIFCAAILLFQFCANASFLESVSDDDLVQIIKKETYCVVLFSKRNCDECDKLEGLLYNLKNDILETLEAQTVKAFNSQLVRLYSPTKEPAIIFFRHGVPILYDGAFDEDSILQKFSENKDPNVKELADATFEHLTQASSGSTTGDWFVMFYTQECVECQRLTAVWEAVASSLKSRLNVARVNTGNFGVATGKRFKIKKAPEFILIRKGKFYRYEITKYDVKSFVTFAQEWYKNATPEKITVPISAFDEVVATSVEILKNVIAFSSVIMTDHPYIVIFVFVGFLLTALTAIISKFKASGTKDQKKKKKKAK